MLSRVIVGHKVYLGNYYNAITNNIEQQKSFGLEIFNCNPVQQIVSISGPFLCLDLVSLFNKLSMELEQRIKELDINDENVLPEIFSHSYVDATHIITSITYGKVLLALFTCHETNMDFIWLYECIDDKLNNSDSLDEFNDLKNLKIDVEFFTHSFSEFPKRPKFYEALNLFKNYTDSDNGYPVSIRIYPIASLLKQDYLSASNMAPLLVDAKISKHIIYLLLKYYKTGADTQAFLNHCFEYYYALSEKKDCFEYQYMFEEFLTKPDELIEQLQCYVCNLRTQKQKNTLEYKQVVEELVTHMKESSIYHGKFNQYFLTEYYTTMAKTKSAVYFKKQNIPYIGRGNTDLKKELMGFGASTVYVFFYDRKNDNKNKENSCLFSELINSKENCIFFNLNLVQKPNHILKGTRIVSYKNRKVQQMDCLARKLKNQSY